MTFTKSMSLKSKSSTANLQYKQSVQPSKFTKSSMRHNVSVKVTTVVDSTAYVSNSQVMLQVKTLKVTKPGFIATKQKDNQAVTNNLQSKSSVYSSLQLKIPSKITYHRENFATGILNHVHLTPNAPKPLFENNVKSSKLSSGLAVTSLIISSAQSKPKNTLVASQQKNQKESKFKVQLPSHR